MQDFPRLYKGAEKVGFTSLNRPAVRQYSPVKNNVGDAAKKQASGLEPACAAAGEFDVYRFNCDYLRAHGAGMAIGEDHEASFLGIQCKIPPAASLSAQGLVPLDSLSTDASPRPAAARVASPPFDSGGQSERGVHLDL